MKAGYPWQLAIYSGVYYMTNAVQQGYLSRYYRAQGIEGGRLTMLLAAAPLAALAALPLWGIAGDRAKSRKRVLRWMTVMAMGAAAVLGMAKGWGWMLACSALLAAAFTSIQPMGDSIVLEKLEAGGYAFGPIRLAGCAAFALSNLGFGWVLEGERIRLMPWLAAGMLGLTLMSSGVLPQTPGHQSGGGHGARIRELFGKRRTVAYMALFMLLQMTMGYFYSFFPVYYPEMPGGSMTGLGLCHFLASVSEIPFLIWSQKLYKRLGTGRLLLLAAGCMGVRWGILAVTGNIWVVLASQILHGGGFIVITVCMAMYMAETVPRAWRATGQMILGMCGFGAARLFGILCGGWMAGSAGGIRAGFAAMAGLCAAGLAIFGPGLWRDRQKMTKNTD